VYRYTWKEAFYSHDQMVHVVRDQRWLGHKPTVGYGAIEWKRSKKPRWSRLLGKPGNPWLQYMSISAITIDIMNHSNHPSNSSISAMLRSYLLQIHKCTTGGNPSHELGCHYIRARPSHRNDSLVGNARIGESAIHSFCMNDCA
jgi:hypothetical protein